MESVLLETPLPRSSFPEPVSPNFPASAPLSSAAASLHALVHHAGWVEHDAPLEQVQSLFAERQVEFLALVRDGIVTGLCSRARLGLLFGTRYGFALYSRAPAHLAQIEHPLVFSVATPLRQVLDRALGRPSDEFHDDVALVDSSHALIGLIPVDALARLQTQFVSDQVVELQRSQAGLLAANEALRQSQGRYAGLFESRVVGIALLDAHGCVETNNERLAELLNVPAAMSQVVSLTPWLAETDRSVFIGTLESLATGALPPSAREFTFIVPGHGTRQFRCSMAWIEATRQICACIDDVTDQRAMERQFLRQEKQILLDTLVGGIAHELNNKLTPVQGFSELIALSDDSQTRNYAALIGRSVAEAAHIIRQLLQLSKPAAGVTQTIDLRAVVDEALSMLRFQVREAQCLVRHSQPAQPVWVQVDPAEMKQVVINLALNALQAMQGQPNGALEIETLEQCSDAQIIVSDNGIGIPPENLERIFDPFFTTKGPERGSGLGLSVCFGIVRQHAGRIDVVSQPGQGARFTVSLPRHLSPPTAENPGLPQLVGDVRPRAGRDIRVLVVEDEPSVRQFLQTVLTSRFGCDVDTVGNGLDAFERLANQCYALVISDIRMPTMNGTELYLWLREAQPLTAQRFIFVTGYPGENHLERDLADWKIPVLAKPFTIAQLYEACAPFLELGAAIADAAG